MGLKFLLDGAVVAWHPSLPDRYEVWTGLYCTSLCCLRWCLFNSSFETSEKNRRTTLSKPTRGTLGKIFTSLIDSCFLSPSRMYQLLSHSWHYLFVPTPLSTLRVIWSACASGCSNDTLSLERGHGGEIHSFLIYLYYLKYNVSTTLSSVLQSFLSGTTSLQLYKRNSYVLELEEKIKEGAEKIKEGAIVHIAIAKKAGKWREKLATAPRVSTQPLPHAHIKIFHKPTILIHEGGIIS